MLVKKGDAEARFKEIAEAWEVLSDEERRAEYDEQWKHRNDPRFGQYSRQGQQNQHYHSQDDFGDIFSSMFGRRGAQQGPQRTRGQDFEIEIAVFLEDTLEAHKRPVSFKLPVHDMFGRVIQETPKRSMLPFRLAWLMGSGSALKGRGLREQTEDLTAISGW